MWIGVANNDIIIGTNTLPGGGCGCDSITTKMPMEGMLWESDTFQCLLSPLAGGNTVPSVPATVYHLSSQANTIFVLEMDDEEVKMTTNNETILPDSTYKLDFSDNGYLVPSNYGSKPSYVDYPATITASGKIANTGNTIIETVEVTIRLISNSTSRAMELILNNTETFYHPVTYLPCTNEEYLQYMLDNCELKYC